jgi:hypothetical protein
VPKPSRLSSRFIGYIFYLENNLKDLKICKQTTESRLQFDISFVMIVTINCGNFESLNFVPLDRVQTLITNKFINIKYNIQPNSYNIIII